MPNDSLNMVNKNFEKSEQNFNKFISSNLNDENLIKILMENNELIIKISSWSKKQFHKLKMISKH
jgi:hypothetical protein